ncbi:MAG: hypothetical protein FWD52_04975 [Candidatus Bathyarchaeota archaeon]|nr:hypothetical protein [Candidatus Termiticorpusculum sp.]
MLKGKCFELVSVDAFGGVRVFDRTVPGNRTVTVTFAPKGVVCSHCLNDSFCVHVEFVVTHLDMQKIVMQKRKAGWNIPEP